LALFDVTRYGGVVWTRIARLAAAVAGLLLLQAADCVSVDPSTQA
jgi:hypothetical protein